MNTRPALIASLDRLAVERLTDRKREVAAVRTRADVARRQADVRATIERLLGGIPSDHPPLAARTTHRIAGDGFAVETVIFDSEPGQHVTANLLLPEGGGPHPAIVISPGHSAGGKASDYSFAANFARNGFVVLTWDPIGQGERQEYFDPVIGRSRAMRPTGAHSVAAYQSLVTGVPIARRFLRDGMRAVDFLASRPEVDRDRIGAFGCSGGGTMTAYLGALDPRVKAVASACYVTDFAHLLPAIGPQDAEQSIPGFIAAGLDIVDWVELAAPKPYAVISTTEDMFPFAGARAAVAEARRFWEIAGAADRFHWFTGPGPHGAIAPMGDRIVDFFRGALGADAPRHPFERRRPERPEQLDATDTGQLVTAMPGETMAKLAAARAAAVAPRERPDAEAIGAAIRQLAGVAAQPPRASRAGADLRIDAAIGPIEARLVTPSGTPNKAVLILDDPAVAQARAEALAAGGALVAILPPRGADGTEEIKAEIVGDQNLLGLRAMLVGKTLVGLRIEDALGALAWLDAREAGPVSVIGIGETGPVALQAALLDRHVASVRIEASQISIRAAVDRSMQRDLPPIAVPGMVTAYDLPDVIAALAPRVVEIAAPIDPVGQPLTRAAYRRVLSEHLAGAPHVRFSSYVARP
ncbi:MAG TPA: acetylxylan esterase [Sphingomonas sp.]|nr:acetylxylan esterase [Sphingomonas sp.]